MFSAILVSAALFVSSVSGADGPCDIRDLSSKDSAVRYARVEALGKAKCREAVPALLNTMRRDKVAYIRSGAIHALGRIGDPGVVEPLIEVLLKERDETMRNAAAVALGAIKDVRALGPLMATLMDVSPMMRASASWSLGELQDARALRLLGTALSDSDALVRSNSAWSLGRFEDARAAHQFVAALKTGLLNPQDPAVKLSNAAVDATMAALSSPQTDPRTLEAGLKVLRRNAGAQAAQSAIALLKDPREQVRLIAVESMQFTPDPAVVAPLLAALGDTSEKISSAAKAALLRTMASLAESADAKATPFLIPALKNPDPDVRKAAAAALGEFDDPEAAAVLNRAAETNDLITVAAAYAYFVREGNQNRERLLLRALDALGDSEMAKGFLNCGNATLSGAGRKWRIANGLDTDPLPPELVTVTWDKPRPSKPVRP